MPKLVCTSIMVVTLILMGTVPGFAWWRGGVWVVPFPYPYYPYPYYGPPVVEQPVIIQQQATDMYAQPAPQQAAEPAYWYYCQEAKAYYPYVQQCPKGWMKVVPTPPAQQPEPPQQK